MKNNVEKRRDDHLMIVTLKANYYMARACKYIRPALIGQYLGPDFPVMPMGIMSNVNARLVKRGNRHGE